MIINMNFEELEVPERIAKQVNTPHSHECEGHPPLWIIWKKETSKNSGTSDGYFIDSICDSMDSLEYHLGALLWESKRKIYDEVEIQVERVPANHRFGEADFRQWERWSKLKVEKLYKHEGG